MDEEQILKWLLGQLERDEIEDVTDEMLDTMIKEGRVIAVLFCKYKYIENTNSKNWRILIHKLFSRRQQRQEIAKGA